MKLTIYTSEAILRCLLTDMKPTVNEPKYPVWVNFINTAIADIKYRPNPFVDPEEKEEDSIETLVGSYTQKTSNESISSMNGKEIALMYQIERCQIEHPEMIDLRKDILRARSIVILDISPVVAEYISNNYGIICHAFSTPPEESPILYEGREVYFKKDSYEKFFYNNKIKSARAHLLTKYPINPMNSLILIDRYFMSFDGYLKDCRERCEDCTKVKDVLKCPRTTPYDGWDNIVEFLKQILPQSLNEDFHLLLLYDGISLKSKSPSFDKYKFIYQAKLINEDIKNKLDRPYKIEIEIISLTYTCNNSVQKIEGYHLTHNRRILSNFFVIRAEHSLKLQRGSKMLYSQYVSLDWIASKGLISYKDSDLPEVCITDCINTIKSLINNEKNKKTILFSQNGELKPISEIVNRLVK